MTITGALTFGAAVGLVLRRLTIPPTSRIAAALLGLLPLAAYYAWGLTDACAIDPAGREECYGWGFGLAMLVIFGMPPWVAGIVLGYWLQKKRSSSKRGFNK